jgi:hypothetical protein
MPLRESTHASKPTKISQQDLYQHRLNNDIEELELAASPRRADEDNTNTLSMPQSHYHISGRPALFQDNSDSANGFYPSGISPAPLSSKMVRSDLEAHSHSLSFKSKFHDQIKEND